VSMNNLYIGLLTHPKSTYSTEAFTKFISELDEIEIGTESKKIVSIIINQDSELSDQSSLSDLFFSIIGFFWIKAKWALRRQRGWRISTQMRVLKYFLDALFAMVQLFSSESRRIKRKSNLRLRNITDNHSKILSVGLESEANLIVSFEDDINFCDAARSFLALTDFAIGLKSSTFYISVSDSYQMSDLRVEHLKGDEIISKVFKSEKFRLFEMTKSTTNSTSGVIYSRNTAAIFASEIQKYQQSKFFKSTPVDWLLNFALLSKSLKNVTCYQISGGPFKQQSMLTK
jgi:hypothetical protein